MSRKKKTRPTYLFLRKSPKNDVPPRKKKKLSAFALNHNKNDTVVQRKGMTKIIFEVEQKKMKKTKVEVSKPL